MELDGLQEGLTEVTLSWVVKDDGVHQNSMCKDRPRERRAVQNPFT